MGRLHQNTKASRAGILEAVGFVDDLASSEGGLEDLVLPNVTGS
jgi:hypothetical protein